nr:protein THEM6 [Vulpes vulpes]
MLGLAVASLAVALAYFALLDGWYLVRVPCAVLRARLLQPRVRDLLAEQRYAGRVLPSDLDLLLHMNNARYLREADVARAAHLARCGVLGGQGAPGEPEAWCCCVPWTLEPPSPAPASECEWRAQHSPLLQRGNGGPGDEPGRQRSDGFQAGPSLSGRGLSCGPLGDTGLQHPGWAPCPHPCWPHWQWSPWASYSLPLQVEPPELPEDLRHWIAYNETSSQLLRAESGLSDVVKDQ